MTTPFTMSKRVEYVHTDMSGIVHFTEFFHYMESAEHAYFRSLGLSISMTYEGRTISWPRVSCSFDFQHPLRFEDEFEVRLTVEKIGNASVTIRADIVRDDSVLASGTSTCVCCEINPSGELKSISIPDTIRAELQKTL